jgi:uncharacterized protein (DUF885 family)
MTPTRRDLLLSATAIAVLPGSARAQASGADVSGAASASIATTRAQIADPRLGAVFDKITRGLLDEEPEVATFLGVDTGPRAALKTQLNDRSWAAEQQGGASCAAWIAELQAIDPATLNDRDRVNYETVGYALALGVDGAKFSYGDNALAAAMGESAGPYVVNQQSGDFNTVPDFLASQHSIQTRADADAYLDRLRAFAVALDQETARVKRDAGQGVIAPDFILDTALSQMRPFLATSADASGLATSLAQRAKAKGLAGDYAGRAAALVASDVYPALDRQIGALATLRPRAGHDAGVWRLPDGDAYYAWLLKVGTSTSMTADDIHRLGLEQVDAIGARMDALLKRQGLTQGAVGERMKALEADPRQLYPDTPAGREALIAYLNGRLAAVRARLPQAFNLRLKSNVVIKPVPKSIEAGAPLGYESDGSIDGSRPATYYINLHDMKNWPRMSLPTLTFHEAIPGHVWQGAYVLESRSLPLVRSILSGFNAYVEGWALYAEQLGDEMGLYDDDPLGRLGYLNEQRFRACRLVVDTGLHAKRWSREQAIDRLVAVSGYPHPAAQSEIDRYCAWPGQACGYKIGHTEINRLRDRAKAQLGARYSLQGFDDVVVKTAGVPLSVLDGVVDRYIAEAFVLTFGQALDLALHLFDAGFEVREGVCGGRGRWGGRRRGWCGGFRRRVPLVPGADIFGRRIAEGGEHLHGLAEEAHVLAHLLLEQAITGRLGEGPSHLLAHLVLLAGEGVQRHLQVSRHKGLHLVAVELDELAQKLDREQILVGILRLENDLRQHLAGDVLIGLGVEDDEIGAGLHQLRKVVKGDVRAGVGVVEAAVGVFLDDDVTRRLGAFGPSAVSCAALRLRRGSPHRFGIRRKLVAIPFWSRRARRPGIDRLGHRATLHVATQSYHRSASGGTRSHQALIHPVTRPSGCGMGVAR